MKRRFLIALLTFGTFAGFGSGFASMGWHHHRFHQARQAAFENHVADVCVEAARRADHEDAYRDDRPWDRPPPARDHHRRAHHPSDYDYGY